MTSKSDLLRTICAEFFKAQQGGLARWRPKKGQVNFPPLLPVGDGEQLSATEDMLSAVRDYANAILQNSAAFRTSFSVKEFHDIVRLSFGRALRELQTTNPDPHALGDKVKGLIQQQTESRQRKAALVVGCWLFEDPQVYPVSIGPVVFNQRATWLAAQKQAGSISPTTARRLGRIWSGRRVQERKSRRDGYKERSIKDAVDRCPIVCQVETHGLSFELVRQKGLVAARIAIAALSLPWADPQRAMQRMNLIYDGPPRSQDYALLSDGGGWGSGSSVVVTPFGQHSNGPLRPRLQDYQPTFDVVGEALAAFVDPSAQATRPQIANAVFLSLLWFHQGCRETSDQMAVTAFAASLEALTAGGRAKGIAELVEARLGVSPGAVLMRDGRTSVSVITAIYNAGRSQFIHGSSVDHTEDWTPLRTAAMSLAHQVILNTTHWLSQNPKTVDVKALRK
jgi:hypothetical protein